MFLYFFPNFQRHHLKVLCKIVLVCFPRDAFMFEYKTIDMFEVSEKRLKRENTGFSFGAHKIGYRSSPIWRRSKWKKTSHRVFWPNRNTPTWKIYFNCSNKLKFKEDPKNRISTNWVLKELEKEKYIHQNASCWTNHCWKMLVNEKDKFRRIIFFCFITNLTMKMIRPSVWVEIEVRKRAHYISVPIKIRVTTFSLLSI